MQEVAWTFLGGINLFIFSFEAKEFDYDGFYTFPIGLSYFFLSDLALFTFWKRQDVLFHKSQEYLSMGENELKPTFE